METEILKLELPIKCMPVVIILIITLLYWTNNIKLRMEIFSLTLFLPVKES